MAGIEDAKRTCSQSVPPNALLYDLSPLYVCSDRIMLIYYYTVFIVKY